MNELVFGDEETRKNTNDDVDGLVAFTPGKIQKKKKSCKDRE
jgi:hypothetical protein